MAKEEKIIKKKIENLTLTSAFEMIYEESCDSKLSSEFYKTCNEAMIFVSKELNGGQIENIARKQIVDSIFYEHHQGISQIRSYCHSENIRKSKSKRIGFLN